MYKQAELLFGQHPEAIMPITVTCDCGRSYQIASKNAGKKFRCKECGDMVRVPNTSANRRSKPARAEELPQDSGRTGFDNADPDKYEDYGLEDEYVSEPVLRRKSTSPAKQRRKNSRTGMPVTVIVAILCEVGFILINCFLFVGVVGVAMNAPSVNFSLVAAVALIGALRIVINFALLRGFIRRASSARWLACGLSSVGFLLFCLIVSITTFQARSAARDMPSGPFWETPADQPTSGEPTSDHSSIPPESSVQTKSAPGNPLNTYREVILAAYLTQVVMLLLPPSGRYFKS